MIRSELTNNKGALDALYSDDATRITSLQMFSEIERVLGATGLYLCISLLQEHIIRLLFEYWAPRAHISIVQIPSRDSNLLPFLVAIRKAGAEPPTVTVEETHLSAEQAMAQIVLTQSQRHIRSRLRDVSAGVVLELDLFDERQPNHPRYTIVVFDTKKGMKRGTCAALLVPQGREHEFLFSNSQGLQQLATSAQVSRLCVVSMSRYHTYESQAVIQAELSPKILELAPSDHTSIPFLTTAEGVGSRKILETYESQYSGVIWVDEVEEGGQTLRRMVFASSPTLIQSEARVSAGKVNTADLAIAYQHTIIACLALAPALLSANTVVIGVGGGSLPAALACLPMSVQAVDIDPIVVGIAEKHFGLSKSERLQVRVEDGLQTIRNLAQGEEKVGLLIVDVDSKDATLGLSCPPAAFLAPELIASMRAALRPEGMLVVNLVARALDLRAKAIKDLTAAFSETHVFSVHEEDLNRIVVAFPTRRSAPAPMSQAEVHTEAAAIAKQYGAGWSWSLAEVAAGLELEFLPPTSLSRAKAKAKGKGKQKPKKKKR